MNAPEPFDLDDASHCLTVVIGLCELAGVAVKDANGEGVPALDLRLFDAAACLLMKSRDVLERDAHTASQSEPNE